MQMFKFLFLLPVVTLSSETTELTSFFNAVAENSFFNKVWRYDWFGSQIKDDDDSKPLWLFDSEPFDIYLIELPHTKYFFGVNIYALSEGIWKLVLRSPVQDKEKLKSEQNVFIAFGASQVTFCDALTCDYENHETETLRFTRCYYPLNSCLSVEKYYYVHDALKKDGSSQSKIPTVFVQQDTSNDDNSIVTVHFTETYAFNITCGLTESCTVKKFFATTDEPTNPQEIVLLNKINNIENLEQNSDGTLELIGKTETLTVTKHVPSNQPLYHGVYKKEFVELTVKTVYNNEFLLSFKIKDSILDYHITCDESDVVEHLFLTSLFRENFHFFLFMDFITSIYSIHVKDTYVEFVTKSRAVLPFFKNLDYNPLTKFYLNNLATTPEYEAIKKSGIPLTIKAYYLDDYNIKIEVHFSVTSSYILTTDKNRLTVDYLAVLLTEGQPDNSTKNVEDYEHYLRSVFTSVESVVLEKHFLIIFTANQGLLFHLN